MTPNVPIVSEESEPADFEVRRTWDRYWLVDPLDGTREFVNRNSDFTVNIALIDTNRAVLGVVGVPVRKEVFFGDVISGVAYKTTRDGRETLKTRTVSEGQGLTGCRKPQPREWPAGAVLRCAADGLRPSYPTVCRQLPQVLHAGRGSGGFLSTPGTHLGVGYGCGARRADLGRRRRTALRRLRTRVQHQGVVPEPGLFLRRRSSLSLGRTSASRIGPYLTDHWRVAKLADYAHRHRDNRGIKMAEPQERPEEQPQQRVRRRYVSERGPFEIRANPEIRQPRPKGTTNESRALQIFEHSDLAEKYGEGPVREKIIEMHKALAGRHHLDLVVRPARHAGRHDPVPRVDGGQFPHLSS